MGEGLGESLGDRNAPLLSFGDKVLEKCLDPLELEVYSSSCRLCRSLCVWFKPLKCGSIYLLMLVLMEEKGRQQKATRE